MDYRKRLAGSDSGHARSALLQHWNFHISLDRYKQEKSREKGKDQLIDGTSLFKKMRKSLGNKRNEVSEDQRNEIAQLYGEFVSREHKVFDNRTLDIGVSQWSGR